MNLVNVLDKFLDDKEKEVVLAMLKTDGLNPTNLMTTTAAAPAAMNVTVATMDRADIREMPQTP